MKILLKLAYSFLVAYYYLFRPITLGVRLLAIKEDKVLLVRHSYQEAWFLPGGGVKRGETLEQAIRREAREECGAIVGTIELFGAYSHFYEFKSDHIVVFLSHDFDVHSSKSIEIEHVAYFSLHRLPEDISVGSQKRIHEYLRGEKGIWGDW